MNRQRSDQTGVALALVLWMLVALSVLAAGLVSISREGAGSVDSHILSARAFHLGKGAARLAMKDRALALSSGSGVNQASQSNDVSGVYSAQYRFGEALVTASVFPAAGFLSVASSDEQQWVDFLQNAGDVSAVQATAIFSQFKDAIDENSYGSGSSGIDTSTFGGYQAAYSQEAPQGGGGSDIFYVEGLLSLEGMTRALYDRIRRSISPFRRNGSVELTSAPPEIRNAFQAPESDAVDEPAGGTRYFCVELQVKFDGGDQLTQRIWVDGTSAGAAGVRLVRIGRPAPARFISAG